MGFFSWFTAAPKAVDKTLDLIETGAKGIDMLVFTDEEKARMSVETMQLWIKVQETIKDESSIRSVTRRVLAVMILGEFCLFLLMAGISYPMDADWATYLLSMAKELSGLTLLVAGFYFGYYGVSNIIGSIKKKQD